MHEEAPKSGQTVDRLLGAAEEEFAARGFAEARLEDIAARVGVRRASLLYHFASKQVLYERVLERAFSELRSLVVQTLGRPAATYAERLDDVTVITVDVFTRRPLFARLCLRDALDGQEQACERARLYVQPLLELGEAFVRAGIVAGEFRTDVDARAVFLFFTGAVMFHASVSDAQRDVLWGPGRASGRGLRGYRDEVRGLVRRLVLLSPNAHSKRESKARNPVLVRRSS